MVGTRESWCRRLITGTTTLAAAAAVALACGGQAMAADQVEVNLDVNPYYYAESWDGSTYGYIEVSVLVNGEEVEADEANAYTNFSVKSSDESVATARVANDAPGYGSRDEAFLIINPLKQGTATVEVTYQYNGVKETATTEVTSITGKWVKDGKSWKYDMGDENYMTEGISSIDGKNYAFDKDGKMLTGWVNATELYDFAYSDGYKPSPQWYYMGSDGAAKTGWQKISGKWYFFNQGGTMAQAGTRTDVNGYTYGFGTDGAMKTGWFNNNTYWSSSEGKWVNVYTSSSGEKYYNQPRWYYFGSNGAAKVGWNKISGKWYYLGTWGYPVMYTGDFYDSTGTHYVADTSGAMKTGWYNNNKYWNNEEGKFTDYYLDEGEKVYRDPTWYYASGSGALVSDWQKIGGKWYYFGTANSGNVMCQACVASDTTGTSYAFDVNGAMKTGWFNNNLTWDSEKGKYVESEYDEWVYANKSGALTYGWQKVGGKWYYLGSYNSKVMMTGWFQPDDGDTWYYADENGVMQANKWIDGVYYVTDSGAMAVNTWIGKYHVNSDGVWDQTK